MRLARGGDELAVDGELPAQEVDLVVHREAGQVVIGGYASVFDAPYDLYGGPDQGGWAEVVDRGAFDATLAAGPDVHLLVNHRGWPIARTTSGTLQLATDRRGLKVVATLDPDDLDVQRLVPKMRRRDITEMSFAFRTRRDRWSKDGAERRLLELDLHRGDVSIVNFGANPATTVALSG